MSVLPPNQQARGVAVSKAGHVAVGINDGSLTIRSAKVNFISNFRILIRLFLKLRMLRSGSRF